MEDNKKFQISPVTVNAIGSQAELIVKTFALNRVKREFFVVKQDSQTREAELRAIQEGNQKKYLSAFGLPVFDAVTFKGGSFINDDDEQVFFDQVELGIALVEITQNKHIVKTPIAGRSGGFVHEYINNGDFEIRIRGVIASKGINVFPENEVADLIAICNVPEAIEVASNVFQRFGIDSIVIESFNFYQDEGMRNIQRFEINAVSEFPFELKST